VNTLDSLFHRVARPSRYTGNEWNSFSKPWEHADLRIALCYPDAYEVGMSNLALPILYEAFNSQPGVLAERVFPPWMDMEQALRQNGRRLFSLESRHDLCEFDVVAFSLGYELTYTNVLSVLDLGGIPLLSSDRTSRHPLVIAGGSCTVNPEPMSDFIDLFFIGEVEESITELVEALRGTNGDRHHGLRAASKVSGVYVPSLYEPRYGADGSFLSLEPKEDGVPARIQRRIVDELPPPPSRPIVPFLEAVHDYGSIEIQRGCTRGCRFCQAGMIYRPLRTRSREQVVEASEQLARHCGYSELSLLSLSSSDYPEIEQLVADLSPLCQRENISLSLPSLRLGPESVRLLEALPGRRGGSFTFAPEAGTERLRRAINKNVTEEDIFSTLEALLAGGWSKLKFYFMMGLPTETDEDVAGITSLVRRAAAFDPHLRLNVSVNLLVPKPHTPCERDGQDDGTSVDTKVCILKQGLRGDRIKLSWPDVRVSRLEAALSRGDRRLGRVILHAWQAGSRFDAWGECFAYDNWLAAFQSCGLCIDDFASRAREPDEPLPWEHVDTGVSTEYLAKEHARMLQGEPTADCRVDYCNACGLQSREGGCPQAATAP
jgi:radical SAM family uncharacterized protein